MNKDYLKARFPLLMLVFTFGGIFGFIYEEIFYRFDLGEWVKRGTTFGPWIPIYGFGGLIILGLTFFHVRLWDYNEEILNWGNINGFVCARSVLFFGIAGVFLQFVVIPVFEKLEKKMPKKAWLILCYVPAAIFALDIIASLIYRAVVK